MAILGIVLVALAAGIAVADFADAGIAAAVDMD